MRYRCGSAHFSVGSCNWACLTSLTLRYLDYITNGFTCEQESISLTVRLSARAWGLFKGTDIGLSTTAESQWLVITWFMNNSTWTIVHMQWQAVAQIAQTAS